MIPDPSKMGRKTFVRAVQRAEAAGVELWIYDPDIPGWETPGAVTWAHACYDAARVPNVFDGWAFLWREGGAAVHA